VAQGLCGAGPVWRGARRGLAGGRGRVWLAGFGLGGSAVRAGLAGRAVAVASVAHAAGGAVKLAIIVVDSGLVVVLVHYRPPNPPRSPNQPWKS